MARRTVIEDIPESCIVPQTYDAQKLQICLASFSYPDIERRGAYMKKFMGTLMAALSPIVSILSIAKTIGDIFEVLKATATLDPVKIFEALANVIKDMVDILRMVPMTAIPVFIFDLLRLFVELLEVLEGEIQAIVDMEASIVRNQYNNETVECILQQLGAIKEQKVKEFGSLLLILEPINVLLKMIGMNEIGAPGGSSFESLLPVISGLRLVLSKIVGDIK